VRGGSAHEPDEMVVLFGAPGVGHDRTDTFGVCFAGGVEAEADLDKLILQVSVDGLGAADDLDA